MNLFLKTIQKITWLTFILLSLSLNATEQNIPSQGPGISQEHFENSELFTVLSTINKERGASSGHSSAVMYQGYLVIVEASDSGGLDNSVISFWDISNARDPKLVVKHTAEQVPALRNIPEGHSIGFINRQQKTFAVLRTATGISIWDWSKISTIEQVAKLDLAPLTPGDYANTAWWFANVGRYIYVSATNHGLYVVDAANIENLTMVKHMPISHTGGFKMGPVFGMGNMLVASTFDDNGITTFNLDQANLPKVADIVTDHTANIGYASLFNGGYLYGGDVVPKVWRLKDIYNIELISQASSNTDKKMGDKGAYGKFKDGFVHQGVSNNSAWINYQNPEQPRVVKLIPRQNKQADLDSGNLAGHLAIASCDHSKGSQIFPIATSPDTTAPSINYSLPAEGAKNYPKSASLGLSFTDQLDQLSVNHNTIYLADMQGNKIASYLSVHDNLVSLTPVKWLKESSSYQIIVEQGGIKDFAQNAIPETVVIKFSTGEHINLYSGQINDHQVGSQVSFNLTGLENITPAWWQFWQTPPQVRWQFTEHHSQQKKQSIETLTAAINNTITHQFTHGGKYTVTAKLINETTPLLFSKVVMVSNQQINQTSNPKLSNTAGAMVNSSNTVALSRDGSRLYTSNPDNNSITAINTLTHEKVFETPAGNKPRTLALYENNIWVNSENTDELLSINASTGILTNAITLPYGTKPYGLIIIESNTGNSAKAFAYISSQSTGAILKIDLASKQVITNQKVSDGGLRALAYNKHNNTLYSARFISASNHGELIALTPDTLQIKQRIPLAIDLTPDREDNGRGLPTYISQIAIAPSGNELWFGATKANILRGLARDGNALTFDNTVRAIMVKVDLIQGKELPKQRIDLDDRALPHTSVFSPNGNYIFVSLQGSNLVEVINKYDGSLVATINTKGNGPEGLALSADGNTLYVHSQLSRTVEIFNVSDVVKNNAPDTQYINSIALVNHEKMSAPLLAGKKIFYHAGNSKMSLNGYIACASCHLDGEHDGRIWDFTDRGEGLRNTINLSQTSGRFLHWSANFNELQDFENDIRGQFNGSGLTFAHHKRPYNEFVDKHAGLLGAPLAGQSPELDQLAFYTASLASHVKRSPYRSTNGDLTPEGKLGRQIFLDLQCQQCHGGENFLGPTTPILADVGTFKATSGSRMHSPIAGLDIPTLKGLWLSAPYLHDGSAATLADVLLTENKQQQHGSTHQLSSTQLEQLISYLQQLDDHAEPVPPANTKNVTYGKILPFIAELPQAQKLGKQIARLVQKNERLPVFSKQISYNTRDAYHVQAAFNMAQTEILGEITGYKIAFANKKSQQHWGVKAPIYAPIFTKQNLAWPLKNKKIQTNQVDTLASSDYHHFHIEAELAIVLNQDVTSPLQIGLGVNKWKLKRLIKSVHIAYDLPDNYFNESPQEIDIIASGAGAKHYLLGPANNIKKVNIDNVNIQLYKENTLVYQGNTSTIMGSPYNALSWLLKTELAKGKTIPKGSVILTGAVDRAYGANTKDIKGVYKATAKGFKDLTLQVK